MRQELLVKAGIVTAPLILFGGLLWNHLGLSGVKTVHYRPGDSSPFIQSLLPSDRVAKPEAGAVEILDEPVYFSVFAPPGNWQTADVKLSFATGERAVLELGVLKDLFAQAYDFRPMANTVIENLETNGWLGKPVAKLGPNINVFSRRSEVTDVATPLKDSEIAVYRASLPWAPPRGATLAKKDLTVALPLQGPHELFTAIGDEEALKIAITLHDLNLVAGADEGVVRVFSQSGEMVGQAAFTDDGNVLADSVASSSQTVTIAPDGLPAGVYRVVLSATSDIVFEQFVTRQNYLVVKNAVTLAPHEGIVLLNTSAKKITLEPLAAEALGTATFGSTPVTLSEVKGKVVAHSIDREISAIILPGGQTKITGEGFFALGTSAFFTPEPAGFSNFLAAPESYKAVAAYFLPQTKEGNWRTANSSFELATLAQERGAYKFVLSAPLVREVGGEVKIHGVDITFRKPPLTVRSFLSSLKSFVKDLIW